MALKKSEKRMLMLLGIVVVVAGFYKFVIDKPKAKNVPQANQKPRQEAAKQAIQNKPTEKDLQEKKVTSNIIFEQYNEWGRDPFTIVKPPPPKPKPKPPPPIKVALKGIIWKEGTAYVLIDDYVLCEGEEEGGIKVLKIEGKNVICRKGGRQFTLHWREPS